MCMRRRARRAIIHRRCPRVSTSLITPSSANISLLGRILNVRNGSKTDVSDSLGSETELSLSLAFHEKLMGRSEPLGNLRLSHARANPV